EPVAYFETQNVDKELRGRLMVRRMQHDMTDALGERLAPLLHSRLAALDAAGNFEGQAVGGEEPEAVTAAQGRQLARLEDDLAARCTNPFEQLADVASIGRRERDDVYARFRAAAQTDAVELRAAFGGEMPHALEFADLAQPPFFSIEGSLRVEVRHAVAHVSYVRYSCHGPFSSFMTLSKKRAPRPASAIFAASRVRALTASLASTLSCHAPVRNPPVPQIGAEITSNI